MNPEQNKSGASISSLMTGSLVGSFVVPIVVIIILVFLSFSLDKNTFLLSLIIGAVVVLVGELSVNYLVQRKIKDRFQEVTDVCRDYVGGDRSMRSVVNGDDDFAQLCATLNTVMDNQGPASSVGLSAGSSDAAALQAQIEKLLQEVSAVGDGDLRVQAEVTPDTLGVLADSFNYMIEELAKVVGRVQSTAVQVTNATRRILDRSADLAQNSEAQVNQISQTTESVEALAVFIQTVARNAQLSVEAAQDALHNAANGQQAVRQTIEGMVLIRENVQETSKKIKRLGERSNEIGEIVRIIEDIADQTNLLALNAAIQSAMAGEHGRGFAVVADEIRLLAERSTESTKRIATLVKSIQGDTYEAVVAMEDSTQEVVKGSQLADDAGRSLNSIYGAVDRQAKMIESIAQAANDQTTVSEAVAVAMSRISEITRQTDAGTQEAAVSVSYLAELSEQLRASVSTFRLPERNNEMLGSFASSSLGELPESSNDQTFASALDGDWGQGQEFSGTFPPLPEPGNSGSLLPMSARSTQFGVGNQQDQMQQNFANGQAFPSMPGLNGVQSFADPLGNSNPNNSMDLNGQPQFANAQEFGGFANFDNQQQGFNSGSWFNNQQFNAASNPGGQLNGNGQIPNAGLLPTPLSSVPQVPRQQRWSDNLQQNQTPFNQEQRPFRERE
jgi:methyl-accepting chemotaxis protein